MDLEYLLESHLDWYDMNLAYFKNKGIKHITNKFYSKDNLIKEIIKETGIEKLCDIYNCNSSVWEYLWDISFCHHIFICDGEIYNSLCKLLQTNSITYKRAVLLYYVFIARKRDHPIFNFLNQCITTKNFALKYTDENCV